jgi:threonine/homoserine/homoserine lactone efflux protein
VLLSAEQFWGFLPAALMVTLAPGPDLLATMSLGISRGRRVAVSFGLGCASGCLIHTALAAAGISSLLQRFPSAEWMMRTVGGCYLLWLAWGILRPSTTTLQPRISAASNVPVGLQGNQWTAFFLRGLTANLINPKVALFFLSFFSSFLESGERSSARQLVGLGLVFTAIAVIVFSLVGLFSGRYGRLLRAHPRTGPLLDRICALVFVYLAVTMLLY